MKEFIPQRFSQNLWRSKMYTQIRVSLRIYTKCAYIFFLNNFLEIASIGIFFFENLTMNFFYLDGLSTYLNVNGSQDGCALDCPTTEEGCVKQTCCQTNNNKVCTNDNCPNIFRRISLKTGLFFIFQNQQASPTASPFMVRQRSSNSRNDGETGKKITFDFIDHIRFINIQFILSHRIIIGDIK